MHELVKSERFLVQIKGDGIYLYKKISPEPELHERLAKLSVEDNSIITDSNGVRWKQTQKITLIGSIYDLLYAIVDTIVNRSLKYEFNFEEDNYAKNLRIIFSLLVPKLDLDRGHAYDKRFLRQKNPENFDIDHFIAVKRLLDSDRKKPEDKQAFLRITGKTYQPADVALDKALNGYASEDSDGEASESEDEAPASSSDEEEHYLDNFSSFVTAEQIEKDKAAINEFLKKRNPAKDSLAVKDGKVILKGETLLTEFVIAGFRGINHMPLRFSDEARRVWRSGEMQERRLTMPYFSEAVLQIPLHFDFYRYADGIKTLLGEDANLATFTKNAEILEGNLLATKNEDYILTHGLSNAGRDDVRLFDNFLYFLQHIYSNGIIKTQRFLREHLLQGKTLIKLPNAYNPFVSESEAPDHAFRYALGLKNLYQPAALHPHYKSDGSRSFPYLGEIYISIRNMEVFFSDRERHQVRRLESQHRVNPKSRIGPEIESTGFAWLPKGEIVFSEAVKCPSFKGRWTSRHKEKYGLSKGRYNWFKQRLIRSRSKAQRLAVELDILNHLNSYFSKKLLMYAVDLARNPSNPKVLTFLDANGQLSFELPKRNMTESEDNEAKGIRRELELALYRKVKHSQLAFRVKLTSKYLTVYRIPAEQVEKTLDILRQSSTSKQEYDRFRAVSEQLRTPPSQTSTPRTPASSSSSTHYVYTQVASPTLFETQRSLRLDAIHQTATPAKAGSNDWYDDSIINELLRYYFPRTAGLKTLDALPLNNESDMTSVLISRRFLQAFDDNTNVYYLPLRIGGNHWIGLYVDRTKGNPLIYWIDPYGGLSSDKKEQIIKILNDSNILHDQITERHVHFQDKRLQNDGDNCGPWIIEILRHLRVYGGFPEKNQIDINLCREQHMQMSASLPHTPPHSPSSRNRPLTVAGLWTPQQKDKRPPIQEIMQRQPAPNPQENDDTTINLDDWSDESLDIEPSQQGQKP